MHVTILLFPRSLSSFHSTSVLFPSLSIYFPYLLFPFKRNVLCYGDKCQNFIQARTAIPSDAHLNTFTRSTNSKYLFGNAPRKCTRNYKTTRNKYRVTITSLNVLLLGFIQEKHRTKQFSFTRAHFAMRQMSKHALLHLYRACHPYRSTFFRLKQFNVHHLL